MRRRIAEIVRKEFLQTLREPRMRFVLVVPPLLQLLIFGYAVSLDVEHTRIGWMDPDRSPESRELEAAFKASPYFEIVARPETERDVERLLDRGEAQAVIRVPAGLGREVRRGQTASVQVLVDGSNSNTASLVASYAGQIVARFGARQPGIEVRSRVWFNPDLRSRNYFVPGVIANLLLTITLMLTSMAIVREKEMGTMEQLLVTPIRPLELIVGKTLPYAALGLVNLVTISALALAVFRVPFRGSLLLLVGAASLYLLTSLGAGLFISTISRTQQQAMLSVFLFFVPAFMLSGFAFPIRNMPEPVQWLTYLNPVRYFMEIVRGVFLKGVGLEVLWPQVAALAVYGVAALGLSAARFGRTVE
ncbi:MAG: ABC transporter permease [Bryobacteraceae bacterium]